MELLKLRRFFCGSVYNNPELHEDSGSHWLPTSWSTNDDRDIHFFVPSDDASELRTYGTHSLERQKLVISYRRSRWGKTGQKVLCISQGYFISDLYRFILERTQSVEKGCVYNCANRMLKLPIYFQ